MQKIYHHFVSMPSPTDETEVKTKFYELAHFPGVLGLVDGTHIRIQKPSENEADYVNRHFYHSINRILPKCNDRNINQNDLFHSEN